MKLCFSLLWIDRAQARTRSRVGLQWQIAQVGRRSHEHIRTSKDKQAREGYFILNRQSQKESIWDVSGVAKTVDTTGTHKATFDFSFSETSPLVSTPAAKVNTVGKC
jgi:hypothetical protein